MKDLGSRIYDLGLTKATTTTTTMKMHLENPLWESSYQLLYFFLQQGLAPNRRFSWFFRSSFGLYIFFLNLFLF
jgi:hypothetical protein